jgi:hypothetical protein
MSSTEIVEPESSTAQELTSSTAHYPASEIGTATKEASTTVEATTSAAEETMTETSTVETTVNVTTYGGVTHYLHHPGDNRYYYYDQGFDNREYNSADIRNHFTRDNHRNQHFRGVDN